MAKITEEVDRYRSFSGIYCDLNSEKLIAILEKNIKAENGSQLWRQYFTEKLQQRAKLQHDDLNFIGNQTNSLYEYFVDCEDEEAHALLYKIEQECC